MLGACDHHVGAESATVPTQVQAAQTATPIAPTQQRLLQRSQERWSKVENQKDLVAAYEFLAPEVKREQSLGTFMGRMQKHRYENPKIEEVVAIKDDLAYVRVGVRWTSLDPLAKKVKLEPGQTMTQEFSMIETWRFVEGDWSYVRPQNDRDFFEDHPELLRGDVEETAKPVEAAGKQ